MVAAVDGGRHERVAASGDHEQRRARVVAEIYLRRPAGSEPGQRVLPEDLAGLGRDVAIVRGVGVRVAQGVDEGVAETLVRPAHHPSPRKRRQQDRVERAERCWIQGEDAVGWRGVDGYARSAETAIEQDLCKQSAK